MNLYSTAQYRQLLRNGQPQCRDKDQPPVVKWFTPDAGATWLITQLYPNDPDLAFGLCDLGVGSPELGYVLVSEIKAVRGRLGLFVEREIGFKAVHPLSVYAEATWQAGCITTDGDDLAKADWALLTSRP